MATTPPPTFVEVYRPADHTELAVVRIALEGAGIPHYVKNEFASLGARAATGADEMSIMVPPARGDEARRVILEAVE